MTESRSYPAGDPLAESYRAWSRRPHPWFWAVGVLLGVQPAVKRIDALGWGVRSLAGVGLILGFFLLLVWSTASRLDRDRPLLWRRLVVGWSVWLAGYVGLLVAAAVRDRFRPVSLVLVAYAVVMLLSHLHRWRRTARGLSYLPDADEVRALVDRRRERRERKERRASDAG